MVWASRFLELQDPSLPYLFVGHLMVILRVAPLSELFLIQFSSTFPQVVSSKDLLPHSLHDRRVGQIQGLFLDQ